MFFGSVFMILLVIAAVAAVVLLIRSFGVGGIFSSDTGKRQDGDRALEILKERFARGEIDAKEFNERKQLLSDSV